MPTPTSSRQRLTADGFSEQRELVGCEARYERPEVVRSSHMDLSSSAERPPGGIVAKQRSGWALGRILCVGEMGTAFRDPHPPESSPAIYAVRYRETAPSISCLGTRVTLTLVFFIATGLFAALPDAARPHPPGAGGLRECAGQAGLACMRETCSATFSPRPMNPQGANSTMVTLLRLRPSKKSPGHWACNNLPCYNWPL